jgi:hypothetical protein
MMSDNAVRVVLAGIFAFLTCIFILNTNNEWGAGDFAPMYVGAQLAGTDQLYELEPHYRFHRERWNLTLPGLRYIRLPFYALMLKPLTWFDFDTALWIWLFLRLGAAIAFVLLWPGSSKPDLALLTGISAAFPVALYNEQDVVFVAAILAAFYRFLPANPFLAGVILSLGAIKPHLIVLVPVLLIAHRSWQALRGFAFGGLALFLMSFAAGGWYWPAGFLRALGDQGTHSGNSLMPNLHGLFHGHMYLEAGASLLVLGLAWRAFRRLDFESGLAVSILGALLISRHAYYPDLVLMTPVAVMLLRSRFSSWLKLLGLGLITPLNFVLHKEETALYGQVALVLLFFGITIIDRQQKSVTAEPERPAEMQPAAP